MSLEIFANHTTPNPGSIIADALRGKSFDKLTIHKVRRAHIPDVKAVPSWCNLQICCGNAMITYHTTLVCDEVDFTVARLIFTNLVAGIPEFIFRNAVKITIPNTEIREAVPEEFHPKVRRSMYYAHTMREIMPDCTYTARTMACVIGLNFEYVLKLVLKCESASKLEKITNYLLNHPDAVFQKVTIYLKRPSPVFDLSLLAGLKTDILCLDDGPFTGFRKFVASSEIPCVKWNRSASAHYHAEIYRPIMAEITADPKCDISENYTLTKFIPTYPYGNEYRDVLEIVKRNCELRNTRRFLTVKPIVSE